MNDTFITWVEQRICELQAELSRLQSVLDLQKEYQETLPQQEELFSTKETPTEAIRRLFTENPGAILSTDDLLAEILRLKESGQLLSNAVGRRPRNLVHASMNWLVKQGFVHKMPPSTKRGPSRYRVKDQ